MADLLITRCRMIARLLSWAAALAIVVLSVVPADERPVTGAGPAVEHIAAFALAAGVFAIGYRLSFVTRLVTAFAYCGGVELLQMPLPTRHARLSDFVVDVVASWCAIAVVAGAERLIGEDRRPQS
jgi:hypothetical protein